MANAQLVTVGKPKIGGAIFRAPVGTELPTDAKTELNEAFKNLGYVSEDGVSHENTLETESHKAWGGDVVDASQTERLDKLKFTLIETLNDEVLKTVYGDSNVTGTLETMIKVEADSAELPASAWVVDMILKGGILKRMVIPCAKVSEIGETVYKDDELTGYEVTVSAEADSKGKTHYEYIQKAK